MRSNGSFYFGTIHTRSFTFEVISGTKAHAERALRAAWTAHQKQTGATLPFAELLDGGTVTIAPMVLDTVYRDGSAMKVGK